MLNRLTKIFLKIFPTLYLLCLGIIFVSTLVFLYRNFYLTLAQAETLELLTRTVSRERLNRKLWNKVIAARVKKLQEGDEIPETIRDPFTP